MKRKQLGFSLIEVLMVLVIIAFSINLVVYSLGDKDVDVIEHEALKVQTMINLASEYAVLNQLELGFHLDKNTFELLIFDGEKWAALSADDVFTAHEFSPLIEAELLLDDLPWSRENLLEQVDWRSLLDSDDEESLLELEKMKIPQVLLLSSGDVSPFELELKLVEKPEIDYFIQGEFMAPVALLAERPES